MCIDPAMCELIHKLLVDDSGGVRTCVCRSGEGYVCGCPGRWARGLCFLLR